eukprot:GHRR01027561.1.p1 GENE.GHRR01027561.1~~GHRR01027561.1.p1  ORF type:complete len:142 (-),score=10.16 GHRR01027561.1:289-714(-)
MILTPVTTHLKFRTNLRTHDYCELLCRKNPSFRRTECMQYTETGQSKEGCRSLVLRKAQQEAGPLHACFWQVPPLVACNYCKLTEWPGCMCQAHRTLYVDPSLFASLMLFIMRCIFPSKSIAHWFKLQVARVATLRFMATR